MLDVFSKFEAIIAEGYIFAINTLIDSLVGVNLSQLAAITVVVVVLASHLFGNLLFLDLVLFLLDFPHNFRGFFVSTKRTFDDPVIFDLMLGPLHEALQMKSIPTNSGARRSGIAFDYLHMANGA